MVPCGLFQFSLCLYDLGSKSITIFRKKDVLKENLQEIRKKRKSTNVQSIEKRGEEVLINNVTAAAAARAAVASVVAVVSNILNSIIQ